MNALKNALAKIDRLERAIRPYAGYASEVSQILNSLAQLKNLIQEPSSENIDLALQMIKDSEQIFQPYRSMPQVAPLFNTLNGLTEDLKEARKDF